MKLKNKVVIVTGGSSGIGYYGIEHFLGLGATVVMASRSKERAEEAIKTLRNQSLPGKVMFIALDLMSLASVDKFVKAFQEKFQQLDVLVNNAGIMFGEYQTTEDGFESQMATNHFGHFALTAKLLPLLIQSSGRIVNISSIAHRRGDIDFTNLNFQKPKSYSPWGAYSRSKLANLLFTYELDRRLKANRLPVTVVAAHPGVSKTNLLFKNTKTQPMYNLMKYTVHSYILIYEVCRSPYGLGAPYCNMPEYESVYQDILLACVLPNRHFEYEPIQDSIPTCGVLDPSAHPT
jgi:NAD(P)-dependent dehydrogenase (short-subunit alcohol dehydrogenase family)